jgi:uncharacterized membrane-anchored protein
MKLKKLFFAVFAVIILLIPLYIILNSEEVLENGHRHKIKLRGYDPFDPFRGKYLRLNFDNSIPCDSTLKEGEVAFVTLEKDSLGFSHFAYAAKTKPKHDDYIKAEILNIYSGNASIKINNLTKYFINEDKAEKAEKIIQKFTTNRPDDLYVAVRVLDGEARLEDIFIEDTPFLTYLEKY